jgi:hypothetical protein
VSLHLVPSLSVSLCLSLSSLSLSVSVSVSLFLTNDSFLFVTFFCLSLVFRTELSLAPHTLSILILSLPIELALHVLTELRVKSSFF